MNGMGASQAGTRIIGGKRRKAQGRLHLVYSNAVRAVRCPNEAIDLLDGLRHGSVQEGYAHMHKLPTSSLRDGLERLRYDGVRRPLSSLVHYVRGGLGYGTNRAPETKPDVYW